MSYIDSQSRDTPKLIFKKKIFFFAVFCIDFTIVWSSQIYSQRIGRNQRIGVFANSKQKTWNFGGSRRRFYSNSGPRSFKKTWKRRSIIKKEKSDKRNKTSTTGETHRKKICKIFFLKKKQTDTLWRLWYDTHTTNICSSFYVFVYLLFYIFVYLCRILAKKIILELP